MKELDVDSDLTYSMLTNFDILENYRKTRYNQFKDQMKNKVSDPA